MRFLLISILLIVGCAEKLPIYKIDPSKALETCTNSCGGKVEKTQFTDDGILQCFCK